MGDYRFPAQLPDPGVQRKCPFTHECDVQKRTIVKIGFERVLESRNVKPTAAEVPRWHIVCHVTCSVSAIDTMISRNASAQTEFLPQDFPQYEELRRRLTQRRAATVCLLAIAIALPYLVIDYFLYPQYFRPLLSARVLSLLLGAGIWVLLRRPAAARRANPLVTTLFMGLGLFNCAVPVCLLGYDVPYYATCILVICGIAFLLPLRVPQAAAPMVGLVAAYILASALHGEINNWLLLACEMSFIATAAAIALMGVGVSEKLRREEFRERAHLKKAYEGKSELAAALADKTAKLDALKRDMEDQLYATSHDLRAPLINVQGFSRELQIGLDQLRNRNGRLPEVVAALTDVDESLQFILAGVAQLDARITSLLSVSRIATRTNPTEQVDLNALLQKLARWVQYQLADKSVVLTVESLPVVVGDPARLVQLFSNLIDNAIKYMGDKRERRIQVGVQAGAGEQRFFVQDTGPGISKEDHEQVFRLFRRLPNADCPGEGIGLTMARKIVEKHGGRIWVESTPGAGTTFWFTLETSQPTPFGGFE
jgi:signal transduction histidine kinase